MDREMEKQTKKKLTFQVLEELCGLTVSDDGMEAWLVLEKPDEDLEYKEEALLQYLKEKEIVQGVLESAIKEALEEEKYHKAFLVAKGTPPMDGENGYYEFFFDTNLQSKPVVLEDGSVDYLNMKLFEEAVEGQLLVRYHSATKGVNGYTVKKQVIKVTDGKNLPPLKGSGFEYDKEKQEYRAKIDGRIVFQNENLKIDPLLVVDEVSYSTGNIKFRGDVLVKDCVRSGMLVEATGDVMVNGNVECATIICDGNVLIKRGATADYKGKILAGGNVSGRFFETIDIEAGDSVFSDYFMNCNIQANKKITATGRKGSLVGGTAKCREEIHVTHLGNRAGVHTIVSMFYEEDFAKKMEECLNLIEELEKERETLLNGINRFEREYQGEDLARSLQYMRLQYQLKLRGEKITETKEQWQKLRDGYRENNGGVVIVDGVAYDGCWVTFGKAEKQLKEAQKELRFRRIGKEVIMESLHEKIT